MITERMQELAGITEARNLTLAQIEKIVKQHGGSYASRSEQPSTGVDVKFVFPSEENLTEFLSELKRKNFTTYRKVSGKAIVVNM